MPGHMGSVKVTTQNLEVVRVDADKNLLLIKGAVPCFVKSGNTDVPGQTAFSYTLPSVSCANAFISIPSLYMK